MLPLEKQGVVSPELKVGSVYFAVSSGINPWDVKVYGTTNLRVVDVGIVPIHLATHTHGMGFLYISKL
jgi:hypothetical protein